MLQLQPLVPLKHPYSSKKASRNKGGFYYYGDVKLAKSD